MACVNWHTVISIAIVVIIKAVGSTFFLLYLPQIFPPVLEESPNSTSTERSTTELWTSPTTLEKNFNNFTTENSRTVPSPSRVTTERNFRYITTQKSGAACPIRWDSFNGRCYFFSATEDDWENSQNRCSLEGATLAVINDIEEQKFLQKRAGSEVYFIGLRYQRSLGVWQWIDNSNFQIDFTSNPATFDCAIIGLNTLEESSCEISHRWICERRAL